MPASQRTNFVDYTTTMVATLDNLILGHLLYAFFGITLATFPIQCWGPDSVFAYWTCGATPATSSDAPLASGCRCHDKPMDD